MAVFASPLEDRAVDVADPAAEEALEDAAADDPVDDALDQRPGADQVALGVEHQVVGDPGRDLGADRVVVERGGRPLGELVRVEQRVGGVARDRREQQRHRRQDREQRRPDPLPLAHPRQPSHAPGGRPGAANLGRLLRALLDIALDDERFAALAAPIRAGEAVDLRASGSIRPYLLAALLDADEGLAGRPALVVAADDVGARDLARALGAYLAPRRVRYYPSRGTGYESHLAPPPHLVGLRIGALDALTAGPATATSRRSSSPARSRSPRRSPTPRCGPRASSSTAARRSTSATSPSCWSRPATSAPTRSRSAASSRSAAASSTSSARPRSGPRGWSCSATRSSRSAGSRPSPSARSARPSGSSSTRRPSWRSSTASWRRSRREDEERPDVAELLPVDSFRAPLDLIGERDRDRARRGRGDPGGARATTGRT